MSLSDRYRNNELVIWLAIVLLPTCILVIGYMLAPELVWDRFLFKYYWGPLEADVVDHPIGGITTSYNPVDTTTYGIIIICTIYWLNRLFRRLGIAFDGWFLLAITPYILIGGVTRALEDAVLYNDWCNYIFIAPVIYVCIGLLAILCLIGCHFVSRTDIVRGILCFTAMVLIYDVAFMGLFLSQPDILRFWYPPVLLAVLSAVTIAALWFSGPVSVVEMDRGKKRRFQRFDRNTAFFAFGLFLLMPSVLSVVEWYSRGGTWVWDGEPVTTGLLHYEIWTVLVIAIIATEVVALGGMTLQRAGWKDGRVFHLPENMFIFLSQFLDAAATYRALELYDYGEKHVVPNALIQATGTAAAMFPLKGIAYIACIYLVDIELGKDLEHHPSLKYLVKVAMVVLGLAPGVRDVLRVAMGV